MFQLRFHGRGGQGVVSAAEMLSVAAFAEGSEAQAFPSFGSERTGAPVLAFCRIATEPIRSREPIAEPDAVIIADPTLLHQVDVFGGLADHGYVLINTSKDSAELGITDLEHRLPRFHVLTLPASEIAREELGRPLPNAALLAGLGPLTGIVGLQAVLAAINSKFTAGTARANVRIAMRAHAVAMERLGERVPA